MSEEPKFGARAENTPGQYGAPDDPNAQPYDGNGYQGPQQTNPAQAGQPYATSQNQGMGVGYGQAQYGNGYPGGAPSGPVGGYPNPGVPAPPLPSRTAPILTIITGALMMTVIPIVIVIVATVSSLGGVINAVTDPENSGNTVPIGSTVNIDEMGVAMVIFPPGFAEPDSCELVGASGQVQPSDSQKNQGALALTFDNMSAGDYTLKCSKAGEAVDGNAIVIAGQDVTGVATSVGTAFLIATICGFVGLILLIVGIVWLVKRNARRREISAGFYPRPY